MNLQSIATESQTLNATIRDLRSVIATDEERLERHQSELKAALLRLDEIECGAQEAFQAIRGVGLAKAEDTVVLMAYSPEGSFIFTREPAAHFEGIGEPDKVAAE